MTTTKPSQFRSLIREMGRIPAERSTTYHKIRVFESEENPADLLGMQGRRFHEPPFGRIRISSA